MNMLKRLNQLSAQLDHAHPHSKPMAALAHSSSIHSHSIPAVSDSDPAPPLRLSASLIIIKPLESTTPDGFNYHTLLLQRNSSQRSFSSAYVFPGGNLDPDDHNHQSLIRESTPEQAQPSDDPILQDSLKICAIRECFEESGILLGLTRAIHNPGPSLQDFRQNLTHQLTKFSNITQCIQSEVPDAEDHPKNLFCLDQLWHFANFLTPTALTKRWNTHFYLTILPFSTPRHVGSCQKDKRSEVLIDTAYLATPDGSETVSTIWSSPIELLRRCLMDPTVHNDHMKVAPPQFYLLSELSRKKDYRELTDFQYRKVPSFTPETVRLCDDHDAFTSVLTLPGDPLHSSSEKTLMADPSLHPHSIKHRIYIRSEPEDFRKKAGNFSRPLRVERCGMQKFFGTGWDDLN